jgi:hypothetical protein
MRCYVAIGLHFLPIDSSLHSIGRQKVVARLGRGRGEQRADLPDWFQDGTVRVHPSQSLLHRSVFLQFEGLEETESNSGSMSDNACGNYPFKTR